MNNAEGQGRDVSPGLFTNTHWSVVLRARDKSGSHAKWLFGCGGGELYFYINGLGIGPHFLAQAPFSPNTNRWYHLELTKAASVFRLYVNGSGLTSAANNQAIPPASAASGNRDAVQLQRSGEPVGERQIGLRGGNPSNR
jgi:hypothetical protein